jgi:hypothetical protein
MLGSCFIENIGEKLDYYKFNTLRNPFGIFYHPGAIENFIKNVSAGYTYTTADVQEYKEQWITYYAHSSLNETSEEKLLDSLNKRSQDTRAYLENTTHVVITLGTAWAYRLKRDERLVANCHKVPQTEFDKILLSIDDIKSSLSSIITELRIINPKVSIIFTVSPVRHIKDGVIENQLSKSHLISALHSLLSDSSNIFYFPSYEIMMDELRDYRFYSEDLLHPNSIAIGYIWSKFCETWMSEETSLLSDKIENIQRGLAHRPFNPDSASHKQFQAKLASKIKILQQEFPHFTF